MEFKANGSDGSMDGYFVVLVKNTGRDVDYERMRDAATLAPFSDQSSKSLTIEADMVVTKNYTDSRQRFAVSNVRHDVSPTSPFPNKSKAKTYLDVRKLLPESLRKVLH